jgi:hypothetical protein
MANVNITLSVEEAKQLLNALALLATSVPSNDEKYQHYSNLHKKVNSAVLETELPWLY